MCDESLGNIDNVGDKQGYFRRILCILLVNIDLGCRARAMGRPSSQLPTADSPRLLVGLHEGLK